MGIRSHHERWVRSVVPNLNQIRTWLAVPGPAHRFLRKFTDVLLAENDLLIHRLTDSQWEVREAIKVKPEGVADSFVI